ncbi:MAG: helix-turn-helix transcriptional regulator [Bryobacteraceae bacterium]
MLILRVAALRPIDGYAIVQRIQQLSKDALQIRQGPLYPALYKVGKARLAEIRLGDHPKRSRCEILQPD